MKLIYNTYYIICIIKYFIILLIGLISGMIESSLGISFLIIPLLLLFNIFSDYKTALGTMLCAFVFPLSLGAVYFHYHQNNIEFSSALVLGISYFIGATIASKHICNISNENLMLFAGIFLLLAGIYYIYKYLIHKNISL
jgi:uncharacterized membrane protein YfcA